MYSMYAFALKHSRYCLTQIRIKKKTSADSHYDNLVQNVLYLDNDGDGCVCVCIHVKTLRFVSASEIDWHILCSKSL